MLKEVTIAVVICACIMAAGIAAGTSLGDLVVTYVPIPGFK